MKTTQAMAVFLGLLFVTPPMFASERGGEGRLPLYLSGWVVYWDHKNSWAAWSDHAKAFQEVSVFAADFNEKGDVTLNPEAVTLLEGYERIPLAQRPRVLLTVVNDVRARSGARLKDPDIIRAILSSRKKRAAHADQLVALCGDNHGLEIDYEELYVQDRDAFTAFIKDLGEKLHRKGKWLSVVVQPKTDDTRTNGEGAMDWKALAVHVDSIKIMAYNLHYPGGEPGPLATSAWIADIARYALREIPVEKLSVALTMGGCDWGSDGKSKMLTYTKGMILRNRHTPVTQRDPVSRVPTFEYTIQDRDHRVWYEDAESLLDKVETIRREGVQHVALWYLGSGDPLFLEKVTQP